MRKVFKLHCMDCKKVIYREDLLKNPRCKPCHTKREAKRAYDRQAKAATKASTRQALYNLSKPVQIYKNVLSLKHLQRASPERFERLVSNIIHNKVQLNLHVERKG